MAIVNADFDGVRRELEELLVNNPALVPTRGRRRPGIEWAAGAVLDGLERLKREAAGGDADAVRTRVEDIADDYARLMGAVAVSGRATAEIASLMAAGEEALAQLTEEVRNAEGRQLIPAVAPSRRRVISAVDQIAIAAG